MDDRVLRWCVWCGPAFVLLFGIGFWAVAGFVPPVSAADSADEIATRYAENRGAVRIGLQISMASSALYFLFVAALSVYIKRIEGTFSPLAYAQLAAGTGSAAVFFFPLMFMQAAGYREDRAPEAVQLLSDLGWIPFVGLFCVPMMQNICLAIATLSDNSPNPVFPRWSGYFNVWIGTCYVPAVMIVFFQDGPFAWSGVFTFWLGAVAFFSWILVMAYLMLQSVGMIRTGLAESSVSTEELEAAWIEFLRARSE